MSFNTIKPSAHIIGDIDGKAILRKLQKHGRKCYKSQDLITDESATKFVRMLIERGHTSVLEHVSISVEFIVDRGVSHELVRHRLASFSQESTRYCNYSKDKFNNNITVINIFDHFKNKESEMIWDIAIDQANKAYNKLIELGESPQIARSVLPNSLKTEVDVTCNLREWMLIFKQRSSVAAHPQMREVIVPLLEEFKQNIPIIFDNI